MGSYHIYYIMRNALREKSFVVFVIYNDHESFILRIPIEVFIAPDCYTLNTKVIMYYVYELPYCKFSPSKLFSDTTYHIRTNIGGSNIWCFARNMHLMRY